jgi:hypothetical protein
MHIYILHAANIHKIFLENTRCFNTTSFSSSLKNNFLLKRVSYVIKYRVIYNQLHFRNIFHTDVWNTMKW